MKKGRCGTMTHDYKRNGTTTLFAVPRHRHREFLRFLKTIDQRTLPNLDLHLIVDNYATHKTPAVKRWLKRHARFHLHFTPTSGSWLNMVERFFAEITRKTHPPRRLQERRRTEASRSWTISTTTMAIPSPTSGPRLPPKSSVKSHVRNKSWIHNTSVWRRRAST